MHLFSQHAWSKPSTWAKPEAGMRCASSLKQRLLSPGKGDGTNVRNNTTKMLVYLSGSCERHESLEESRSQWNLTETGGVWAQAESVGKAWATTPRGKNSTSRSEGSQGLLTRTRLGGRELGGWKAVQRPLGLALSVRIGKASRVQFWSAVLSDTLYRLQASDLSTHSTKILLTWCISLNWLHLNVYRKQISD